MATAIEVRDVCKRFRVNRTGVRTLKSAMMDVLRGHRARQAFWALRDVSFTVRAGETLGIIGANGAGKSTLLSILAGTMQPTSGTVRTHGAISSLLELGAGFHPELTGRENVFLWGAIMGLSRRTMRERFDRIVDFAELSAYIDHPVKHYSSGMYVRLGFAVAVECDPEILLVDEVLAVGDASFRRKCLQRMEDFRRRGKTMLIISHDMGTIQAISSRIIFLDGGRILGDGTPEQVVEQYEGHAHGAEQESLRREWGTREAVLTSVTFEGTDGTERHAFRSDEPVCVRIRYAASKRIDNPVFGFGVSDQAGRRLHGSNTQLLGMQIPSIHGDGLLRLLLPRMPFPSGTYLFSFAIHSDDHRVQYHRVDNMYGIRVRAGAEFEGCCDLAGRWEMGT